MRKTIIALSAAAALTATAASPVLAESWHHRHHDTLVSAPVAGAIAGTVFGVGIYNNWWGSNVVAFPPASVGGAPASVGGAIAGGLVVGIGTTAMIHAATTKCTGFHALFGGSGCVNGQYVGR